MKKWLILLLVFAGSTSCDLTTEIGPEKITYPVITDTSAVGINDGGRVSSSQQVYVQGNVSNKYGSFNIQIQYDVQWTDDQGKEHTERKSSNVRHFEETTETIFYRAAIPRQKAGSTVYWMISVTNENGLTTASQPQHYSVYAI